MSKCCISYCPAFTSFTNNICFRYRHICKKWEGVHFVDEAKSPLTPITKVGGKKITRTEWQSILIKEGYFARSIPKEYGGYGGESDVIKNRIIASEFSNHGVPPPIIKPR